MRILSLFIFGTLLFSQDGGYSLRECIDLAMENDPGIRASVVSITKAETVVKQASSAYYPTLESQVTFTKLNEPIAFKEFTLTSMGQPFPVDLFEMSDDQTATADLLLRVPLFTWGKIANYKKMAKAGVEIASARMKHSRISVLNRVVVAHAQVMLAREARGYLKDTISEMELFFQTAKTDFESGARNAPEKDILQIQYDLYDMKTWMSELNKWEVIGLEALKISMGLDPADDLRLNGKKLTCLPYRPEEHKTVQLAMAQNPQIQELEKAIAATVLKKKIEKVSNLPMLGAFGSQTWIEDDFDANPDSITAYGVGLEMKIFDGGLSRNRVKEADLQAKELEYKLQGLKRFIQLQVKQHIIEIDQHYHQLDIRAKSRSIAIKQVEVVRQGYQYGISTVKDVNDSQVQKRWSDANWLFKKLDYIKAVSQLNQSVGKELLALD